MSAVTRPRGPLPPRVYWVRRLLLVAVAVVLVVVVARVLGGGADGDTDARATSGDSTQDAGARETTGGTTGTPTDGASETAGDTPSSPVTSTTTPPAQPTGTCSADDVVVTPSVEGAVAGSPVSITLSLTTREAAACYWTVDPGSTVVKVTEGGEDIWTTQHCPEALTTTDLVVRSASPATVSLDWPAWRSGAGCEIREWSLPGDYEVEAASLAGEPEEAGFALSAPQPEVIERTVPPSTATTD
ncbi:hypothetical protein RDV89_16660 [Nocardioides zeae]|uniref:DUF4232 domain-containing protein n=1 Tax=Nocardioides imazamoxiresistens TaxID=3231893 RepID=A0ABU3Q130_9ACTN|nr:hypothetical protein [Nocardioides zeae]MDT9594720.1 hypothetical protein [Nocardioides zeae]